MNVPALVQSGTHFCGGLAQLGERLNGIQKVVGSIPIPSTNPQTPTGDGRGFFMSGFRGDQSTAAMASQRASSLSGVMPAMLMRPPATM